MTFKIARSVINGLGYDYPAAVEAFRQAKLEHRFTGDIAPSAPAIIEHAVRRVPVDGQADDFVTDYEIVEDVDRRAELLRTVRDMEAAAFTKYLSPARERLMALHLNDVHRKPIEARSAEDLQLLEFADKHGAYKARVQRHAAELEVAIEELTDAAIGTFAPAPFPRS